MKSITLTVEDEVYRSAEQFADREGTSIDELINRYLGTLRDVQPESGSRERWEKMWRRIDQLGVELGEKPTRERTYEN